MVGALIFSLLLFFACPCLAAPGDQYWVSPTGAAAWNDARSVVPLSGAACALYSTANTSVIAGETVWYRGGTYSVTGAAVHAIVPTNSGTTTNPIWLKAYNGEVPLFVGEYPTSESQNSIRLYTKTNFVIDGLHFKHFYRGTYILDSSNYNEITNCTFYNDDEESKAFMFLYIGTSSGTGTHSLFNWIHHNTFHTLGKSCAPPWYTTGRCEEGGDMVRIGSNSGGDNGSNYNTVENNVLYHAGHTLMDDFGSYNVWRNNVFHNEGWKGDTDVVWGTATGGSDTTLIDTTKDFTALGVGGTSYYIFAGNQYDRKTTSYGISTTTNPNDTITFIKQAQSYGSPTFAAGVSYAITGCTYAPDPPGYLPGNGKYSHRTIGFTGAAGGLPKKHTLIEGNRIGFAGTNPANNGGDGITLGSPGNILRYNKIFGGDGPGINMKRYSSDPAYSGASNFIYNNTIYGNGRQVFGDNASYTPRSAIYFYGNSSTSNYYVNNIFHSNGVIVFGLSATEWAQNWWDSNLCDTTDSRFACTEGTPLFINASMNDPMSTTYPTLEMYKASPTYNSGTSLTLTNGSGAASTALIVDCADAFQDGSIGSPLSNIQPDWVAVGTVGNVAQISSIDYSTHTITLASALTWADNAPVWLYKKSDGERVLYGSAPDIGADEYNVDLWEGTSKKVAPGTKPMRGL